MSYDPKRADDMKKWAVTSMYSAELLPIGSPNKEYLMASASSFLMLARTIEWGGEEFLRDLDLRGLSDNATRFLARDYQG